jgi:hypothetical protein
MPKFLLTVDYRGGVVDTPMTEWAPKMSSPHGLLPALRQKLLDSGELVEQQALTGPELAKVVTSDGGAAPVMTDYSDVSECVTRGRAEVVVSRRGGRCAGW